MYCGGNGVVDQVIGRVMGQRGVMIKDGTTREQPTV